MSSASTPPGRKPQRTVRQDPSAAPDPLRTGHARRPFGCPALVKHFSGPTGRRDPRHAGQGLTGCTRNGECSHPRKGAAFSRAGRVPGGSPAPSSSLCHFPSCPGRQRAHAGQHSGRRRARDAAEAAARPAAFFGGLGGVVRKPHSKLHRCGWSGQGRGPSRVHGEIAAAGEGRGWLEASSVAPWRAQHRVGVVIKRHPSGRGQNQLWPRGPRPHHEEWTRLSRARARRCARPRGPSHSGPGSEMKRADRQQSRQHPGVGDTKTPSRPGAQGILCPPEASLAIRAQRPDVAPEAFLGAVPGPSRRSKAGSGRSTWPAEVSLASSKAPTG